ncbi:MAG: DegT/DnrJ/EryC1/StrS family aminotransferase [Acidobacteria bacterium]|nr:DegT/DnrJ/EryC1/StrS family aminotransferase [Acidobacteriota bacterium]
MLDFARQFAGMREEILAAIARVCDSQQFILGPAVESFERAAAEALHVAYAAGCSSGTEALWLALAATGVGPGDAVVTTPFSFFATASSVLRAGAQPLLADIDADTFNLSADAVNEAIERHRGTVVKAVMPVHLYGQCADWDAFTALKQRRNLLLIEDAAQAFGASWRGVMAGGLGDIAAFSFYPTKNLSAMGDAGMLTTQSASLDERTRMLRAHGMRRRYFHDEVGWNSRLDAIQAAVLEVKLRYVAEWNERRRSLAARYDELFRTACLAASTTAEGLVLPIRDARGVHVFHQYTIRAPRRDALREYLSSRRIGSEIYYPLPLHLQQSLAELGYKKGDFPVTERAAEEVLSLPMFPELREDEQQVVVDAVRRFYA